MLAGYERVDARIAHGVELVRQATQAHAAALYGLRHSELALTAQTRGGGFSDAAPPDVHAALRRYEREQLAEADTASITRLEDALLEVELDTDAQGRAQRAYLLLASSVPGSERPVGAVVLSLQRASKAPPSALLRALAQTLGWDDATVAQPTRSVPRRSRAAP
jgi:hypothetical protein